MKADLCAKLRLLDRNVDEMIRLFQCATDAGIWSQQEAARHQATIELLRTKLNENFKELLLLRECANGSQLRAQNEHPATKE
jgi:hypothetical protein